MNFKNLKYFIILFIICLGLEGKSASNKDSTRLKNTIFVELFGTGYYYSFNYERKIYQKGRNSVRLRVGLNWHPFTPFISGGSNYFLGINLKSQLGKNYFISVGAQPVFWITYSPLPNRDQIEIARGDPAHWGQPYNPFLQFSLNGYIGIGRILKKNRQIILSLSPHYFINNGIYNETFLSLWGGISFGKSF